MLTAGLLQQIPFGLQQYDGTLVSKSGARVPKERAIRTGRMQNPFKTTDLTSLIPYISLNSGLAGRSEICLDVANFLSIFDHNKFLHPKDEDTKFRSREEGGKLFVNSF
jgi:hypothetical protein